MNLSSQLAFETNASCPEKVSNRLGTSVNITVPFSNISDFFFFLPFPAAVRKWRKVICSLVLGCEMLGGCLLWKPRLCLHSVKLMPRVSDLEEKWGTIWSDPHPDLSLEMVRWRHKETSCRGGIGTQVFWCPTPCLLYILFCSPTG